MSEFFIRPARFGDESLIYTLLRELAEYEKLLDLFKITEDIIRRDYLSERPLLNCDLAFEGDKPVGVRNWYWTYGSFSTRRNIFLEDLYVRPEFRGKKYGKELLAGLAKKVVEVGGAGVEWSVLAWNKPSIDFYESLGARTSQEWFNYRLSKEALEKLGAA